MRPSHARLRLSRALAPPGQYDGICSSYPYVDGMPGTYADPASVQQQRTNTIAALTSTGADSVHAAAERMESPTAGDTRVSFDDTLLSSPVPRRIAPTEAPPSPTMSEDTTVEPPEVVASPKRSIPSPATSVLSRSKIVQVALPPDTIDLTRPKDRQPTKVTGNSGSKPLEELAQLLAAFTVNQSTANDNINSNLNQLAKTLQQAVQGIQHPPKAAPVAPAGPPGPPTEGWFAVAIGRTPGVYSRMEALFKQSTGFKDASYEMFATKYAAEAWLAKELPELEDIPALRPCRDRGSRTTKKSKRKKKAERNKRKKNRSQDSSLDSSYDSSDTESSGDDKVEQGAHDRKRSSITGSAKLGGKDPSKGEPSKVHGESIYTGAAVKLLSPPHSSAETCEDLMEAVPDVGSLPGKLIGAASELNDQVLVPFECDLCIFRKLTKTEIPNLRNPQHSLLMSCIRRLNLDAFWSRSTRTVQGQRDKLKQGLVLSRLVGLEGPYSNEGPYPSFDHVGYEVAVQMFLMSRRKGLHSPTHLQFDTIRKLRMVYGNHLRALPQANRVTLSLGDQKGRYTCFTYDKCASLWFYRFIEGCQYRMGQIWRPNQALSTDLLLEVL
jgi:hypothetical protein